MLIVNDDKEKLIKYLKKLDISYDFDIDENKIKEIILQDKKIEGDHIDLILVDRISEGYIKKTSLNELEDILKNGLPFVKQLRR